ncbi:MAG: hypothetical protein CVU00_02365 [Bacteroidetes bacterium HGW-Bacteroidetes-17]|jgi:hypothetical protein|nr:MAG: hypothetical protein CVU00_02365 [Bacteroidetes bacterium HGW-Bacteroidetes-17]
MKTNKIIFGSALLLVLFLVTSCAPVGVTEQQYGFLYGIVQGFIFPFVLIAKLLGEHVGLYAENNTGMSYWLGYILGIVILFGGGGGGYARRRRY